MTGREGRVVTLSSPWGSRQRRRGGSPDPGERGVDYVALALRYVGRYACSRARLVDYLSRKGCPAQEATAIAGRLVELGYLDDEEYGRYLVESMRGRYGPRAMRARLREKGIERETIEVLVGALRPDEVEAAARAAAEEFLARESTRRLEPRERHRRLVAFLLRRGFEYGDARKVAGEAGLDLLEDGEP